MTEPMPAEVMAGHVRGVIEEHDKWDSIHLLEMLGWDGEKLIRDTLVGIDPGIDPSEYPSILPSLAARQMKDRPGDVPYAYLLKFEGWASDKPNPTRQPDRVEVAIALAADVEGRMWAAEKRRDQPGQISEVFVSAGEHAMAGGQFTETLLSMAARAREERNSRN